MTIDNAQDCGRPWPGAGEGNSQLNLFPGRFLHALDLFAGIGGLSAGFAAQGFSVIGIDNEAVGVKVYETAGYGRQFTWDLVHDLGPEHCPAVPAVVMGGPPCRPWSAVNLQKRRGDHADHGLLLRFVDHVRLFRPVIFIMENVPALGSDEIYRRGMQDLAIEGYDVAAQVLSYDEYGASSKRRRLFTVGIRGINLTASEFFALLETQRRPARTVGDAIRWLRNIPRHEKPDHDWSELRSIANYKKRYESGQYGWMQLSYDSPAPSFGSVAKTYILHPDSGVGNYPERVISVREALAIAGFDLTVRFPEGTPRAKRYQMVANAVSPQVSAALATVVRHVLAGTPLAPSNCPTTCALPP